MFTLTQVEDLDEVAEDLDEVVEDLDEVVVDLDEVVVVDLDEEVAGEEAVLVGVVVAVLGDN